MVDDARILIAQHAQTAQLMGVDFLPLGTIPESMVQSAPVPAQEPVQDAGHDSAPNAGKQVRAQPEFKSTANSRGKSKTQPEAQGVTGLEDSPPIGASELRASYEHADGQGAQLDALLAKYELEAPHKAFGSSFNKIVFGEGDPNADLMFIGEAPGADEDKVGKPFVGRAGQLLEKMIVAMGFSRESVYICNVLKTRPDGNATPTSHESAVCAPYLYEQIRIVQPRVIVTLGLPASHLLLQSNKPMRALRGNWHDLHTLDGEKQGSTQIMPTYHPAYLLRSYTQANRQAVWSDLQQVVSKLGA